MHHYKLLLLPLLAGTLSFSAEAADCRPDNTNTTITAKSKKFYCTESLDSSGCNAGRTSVSLTIDSSCKAEATIDVICTALFDMKTRKFAEGTQRTVSATERYTLKNGHAEEKLYMTLNSLVDPIFKINVAEVSCEIVETAMPAMNPHPALKPEPMPAAMPKPAPAPAPAPSAAPEPQTKEIVITPAPKPDTAAEDAREREKKLLELEIIKEQNRARELDIKAMELKIKLKEMER